MPTLGDLYYKDAMEECRRMRAWQKHYQAKGCTSQKAYDVAWQKCRSKRTWPPQ